jgi:hypothetical protein
MCLRLLEKEKIEVQQKPYKYNQNHIYYSLTPQCDLFEGNAGLPLYSLFLSETLILVKKNEWFTRKITSRRLLT